MKHLNNKIMTTTTTTSRQTVKGQIMQIAYNPTFSTTYANILRDTALKSQIEQEYLPQLPLITTPIEINAQFNFPDPDIPGFLTSIISYLIDIIGWKPSLPISKITTNSYITNAISITDITIDSPIQIDYQSLCNCIRESSDNNPLVTFNNNTIIIKEQF